MASESAKKILRVGFIGLGEIAQVTLPNRTVCRICQILTNFTGQPYRRPRKPLRILPNHLPLRRFHRRTKPLPLQSSRSQPARNNHQRLRTNHLPKSRRSLRLHLHRIPCLPRYPRPTKPQIRICRKTTSIELSRYGCDYRSREGF